jgi:hypothetical protein
VLRRTRIVVVGDRLKPLRRAGDVDRQVTSFMVGKGAVPVSAAWWNAGGMTLGNVLGGTPCDLDDEWAVQGEEDLFPGVGVPDGPSARGEQDLVQADGLVLGAGDRGHPDPAGIARGLAGDESGTWDEEVGHFGNVIGACYLVPALPTGVLTPRPPLRSGEGGPTR